MIIDSNFEEFCKDFNIVNNALDMRNLTRWNGRNLRYRENLAEHTHLVVTCIYDIVDMFKNMHKILLDINFERLIKAALLHDSVELLRGDILSITKDAIPGLRKAVDSEEDEFLYRQVGDLSFDERNVLRLADLMACYKFIENELQFPNNDFAKKVYFDTKNKYDEYLDEFETCHNIHISDTHCKYPTYVKGYADDAGIDIILQEDCVFMPMSTTTFGLKCSVTPKEGEMALLCARTSAAAKGLCVAMCPIDPNYTGELMAIVHNVSNDIVSYKKGESFCQYIMLPIHLQEAVVKRVGKRSDGKLGSTGM